VTFDPETDAELKAELEVNAAEDEAKTRIIGGRLRTFLVAPAVVIGAVPIAGAFGSLTIMVAGLIGGLAMSIRGLAMSVRGRRELRAARERRMLPAARLRTR